MNNNFYEVNEQIPLPSRSRIKLLPSLFEFYNIVATLSPELIKIFNLIETD